MNAEMSLKTVDLAKRVDVSLQQLIVLGAKCVGQVEEIWPTLSPALADTLVTMLGELHDAKPRALPSPTPTVPTARPVPMTTNECQENELLDKLVRGDFWGVRRIEAAHFLRRSMRRQAGAEAALERLVAAGLIEQSKHERIRSGGQAISLKSSRKQEIEQRVNAWRARPTHD